MMSDLKKIYDRAFYEEWGRNHERYIYSAQCITQVIYEAFQPQRLMDVGCGCGVYSHFFKEMGVDVVSLDGVEPPAEESFPVPIQIRDLTEPIENQWGSFDLTLCLEVAEHIPEKYAPIFLTNITAFSDTLILSAAPPHQGGHHHVNEQPKRYWVKKLADRFYAYNRKKTGRLVETFKKVKLAYAWMGEHISVYDKVKKGDFLRKDLPFSTAVPY